MFLNGLNIKAKNLSFIEDIQNDKLRDKPSWFFVLLYKFIVCCIVVFDKSYESTEFTSNFLL